MFALNVQLYHVLFAHSQVRLCCNERVLKARAEHCRETLEVDRHNAAPSASATVKMSLSPRPHRLTTMI